jgi:mannitol-specific phosphotransferase system IIBC component
MLFLLGPPSPQQLPLVLVLEVVRSFLVASIHLQNAKRIKSKARQGKAKQSKVTQSKPDKSKAKQKKRNEASKPCKANCARGQGIGTLQEDQRE